MDLIATPFGKRLDGPASTFRCALGENDLRRSFGVHDGSRVLAAEHDRHRLAIGVEGNFVDSLVGASPEIEPGFLGGDQQRSLRRIADDAPRIATIGGGQQRRLVAVDGDRQRVVEIGFVRRIGELLIAVDGGGCVVRRWLRALTSSAGNLQRQDLTVRRITGAGHLITGAARDNLSNRHLVAGQRARLVRTNDGDGAQRLDAGQSPDQGVSLDHALQSHRQRQRDDRGHAFGNGRHGEADRQQQDFEKLAAAI